MIKKLVLTLLILTAIMANAQNPFFKPFDTKYQTPPFSKFNNSQWMEAVDFGINKANGEIKAITSQKEAPTFKNTVVALENVGADLNRVLGVYFNLLEANSDDEMMDQSVDISAKVSDYSTSIILNEDLWKRVKTVYDNRKDFNLAPEDSMLLQKTYDSFAQSGANLVGADREQFKKLSAELSQLTNQFGRNVQKELPTYKMYLSKDDLTGLPESQVSAAALAAEQDGHKGEYLFTLDAPVYIAFMKYSDRRDLREKMYRMYNGRNLSGEYSNVDIIKRIVEVRREIANLLGKDTYAAQTLVNTMAQTPENVYNLLNNLRDAYAPAAKKEMAELTEYASKFEGKKIEIMPWDYSYYSNKHRADKYSFDEEAMRPYFELNNVIDGVFGLATRLYGLHFKADPEIEVYHPDVTAYVVTDNDGNYVGVLYTDFFPRASKRPGAWMTNFKEQWIDEDGTNSRPHVSIVMNFTKPVGDKPSLLTPYEIETFLHEFGHSLHGLLANSKYQSLSGTNVYRDFVELPSQFNENYLTEREYLDTFAKHYQTGEPLPEELVNGLISSAQYGAAYSCMRQLQFGYLDMAWHTITAPIDDVAKFEKDATKDVQIFAPIDGAMVSAQFSHIFSGGYAAGYYSYKWAEVLDADAFAQFKKNGIFDAETAKSFRENVLMKGGTENPAVLYRRFRGGDPTIDALLIRDGIKKDETKKPKVDAIKEIPSK
jgi:peptidyl-dipeptidase Dcp